MSKNSNKFKKIIAKKTLLVAEIGQAHEGSINMAHSFIDLCADKGIDAIKFQTHLADKESTYDEPFRIKFSYNDKTRYDYWKRMEFSISEWKELYKHCQRRNILFMSSVFSIEAFNLINKFDVCAWKLASGEIYSSELIDRMIKTKKPIIVSTGVAKFSELKKIVNYLKRKKAFFVLLQCTSNYPVKLENVGLNVMHEYKDKFKCPVGLSDHTGTIYPSIYTVCHGFSLIEFHVAFDRKMFGPDSSSSLDPNQIDELQKIITNINCLRNNPINKDKVSNRISRFKKIFGKSIALKKSLKKGHIVKRSDLTMKKPGNGISYEKMKNVLGKKLKKDVSHQYLLRPKDFN